VGFESPLAHTISTLGLGGDFGVFGANLAGRAASRLFASGRTIQPGSFPVNLLSSSGGFNDPIFSSGGGGWSSGGGTDWGSLLGNVAQLGFGYAGAKQQAKALKRLAKLRLNVPTFGSPLATGFAGPMVPASGGGATFGGPGALAIGGAGLALGNFGGLTDMLPGGLEEGGTGIFGPDLFAPTAASKRQRMISAPNASGEMVYWRPVGKPVLFSGDLSLLKRTRKVLGKYGSFGRARCLPGRKRRR